jgi:hypothetical protein
VIRDIIFKVFEQRLIALEQRHAFARSTAVGRTVTFTNKDPSRGGCGVSSRGSYRKVAEGARKLQDHSAMPVGKVVTVVGGPAGLFIFIVASVAISAALLLLLRYAGLGAASAGSKKCNGPLEHCTDFEIDAVMAAHCSNRTTLERIQCQIRL